LQRFASRLARAGDGRVPGRGVADPSVLKTITGLSRIDQPAMAGKLTMGSSPTGAMLSRVM